MKYEQRNPADICNNVVMDVHSKLDRGVFTTKASKQRATDLINGGYDKLVKMIQDQILSIPRNIRLPEEETVVSKAIKKMYWCIPHYPHQWRKSHSDLLKSSFSKEVEAIESLVELKEGVKNTDVKGGK